MSSSFLLLIRRLHFLVTQVAAKIKNIIIIIETSFTVRVKRRSQIVDGISQLRFRHNIVVSSILNFLNCTYIYIFIY